MAHWNHYSARCWLALRGFTVSSASAVPGVGAFNDPALPHGDKTRAPLRTGLEREAPRGPMGGPPGVEIMLVVLVVPKNHRQTRKGRGRNQRQDLRGGTAIIEAGAGETDREEEPQRVHDDMALPALDVFAPVLAARRAADLRGLDRLTLDADGTRRGLPACGHAGLFA